MAIKFSQKSFKEESTRIIGEAGGKRSFFATVQDTINPKYAVFRDTMKEWQPYRKLSSDIRLHVLDNLDYYLSEFSKNAENNGSKVHFAVDSKEALSIVEDIMKEHKAPIIVKAKSMLSEEVDFNHHFLGKGCDVNETDLAEYILQVNDWDNPSHIIVPSMHKDRNAVEKLFAEKLGYKGSNEPTEITAFVRGILRKKFLEADIGVTGCNVAVAGSGTVWVAENEGNIRMTTTMPKTLIVLMGAERIVPSFDEAELIMNMLAKAAVGARINTYNTWISSPSKGEDGPSAIHIVILDNGRSKILGSKSREILKCIRCGACANICPVYRHVGGHAYGSIYSGPIGVVLSPLLAGPEAFPDLPNACTMCRACDDACPVAIPLSKLILKNRITRVEKDLAPSAEKNAFAMFAKVNSSPFMWNMAIKSSSKMIKWFDPNKLDVFGLASAWSDTKKLPKSEGESFRTWYANRPAKEKV